MNPVNTVTPAGIVWPPIAGWKNVGDVVTTWQSIVADFEADPGNLYASWIYLAHHPLFWEVTLDADGEGVPSLDWSNAWGRKRCLDHDVFEDAYGDVWNGLVISPVHWPLDADADHSVSVEARTFENAVLDAAAMIHERYGNGRNLLKESEDQTRKWK